MGCGSYETGPQPLDEAISPPHTPTPVGQYIEELSTPCKTITAETQILKDFITPCKTPSQTTILLQPEDHHVTPIK